MDYVNPDRPKRGRDSTSRRHLQATCSAGTYVIYNSGFYSMLANNLVSLFNCLLAPL